MHFIWKHRYRCVFDNITPNFSSVIHQVRYYVAQHHLDFLSDAYNLTVRDSHILNLPWEPPPAHFLKINIDASYNSASLLAGIGIITRNSAGAYVMGRGTIRRAINAQQAEAWAMQMAMVNGWTHVIFETDNLGISLYLQQNSSLSHWQSAPLLKRCVNICNINPIWSSKFVYNSCNKAADALAKAARKLNLCWDWWFQPPDLLNPYISYDVSNLVVI
ncbi:uncharacterized protein LOC113312409 [Papaver somniferum]|uniref:uncharacterized protein LOC113312409 n=1 Tax=Papaver somniferum TaxID=3469 RepID=UPI000E7011C1|nr:uncharacterized protein LOC113312409 [Papaver somniferum]